MYQSQRRYHSGVRQSGSGFVVIAAGFAAFDKGFNFRATSGFVTDGANETYVLDSESYPVTRNAVTFGWLDNAQVSGSGRDRNASQDRRIAGLQYMLSTPESNDTRSFRVDLLSPGTYSVEFGGGDTVDSQFFGFDILDDTTSSSSLWSVAITSTSAPGNYGDALGNTYSAANWPASQTAKTGLAFATTRFFFRFKDTADLRLISHLRIVRTA